MHEVLIVALITAFYIVGLHRATYYELDREGKPCEKMVLWFIRYYAEKHIPFGLHKPIISCPTCMASVHGLFVVYFYDYINVWGYGTTCLFIFMVSSISTIINNLAE